MSILTVKIWSPDWISSITLRPPSAKWIWVPATKQLWDTILICAFSSARKNVSVSSKSNTWVKLSPVYTSASLETISTVVPSEPISLSVPGLTFTNVLYLNLFWSVSWTKIEEAPEILIGPLPDGVRLNIIPYGNGCLTLLISTELVT